MYSGRKVNIHGKKNRDKTIVYLANEIGWISRHDVDTDAITNFGGLHERMLIKTEAACGSEIVGWIKRLHPKGRFGAIFLDSNLPLVDNRGDNENIPALGGMDPDSYPRSGEVLIDWCSCAYKYEVVLPY